MEDFLSGFKKSAAKKAVPDKLDKVDKYEGPQGSFTGAALGGVAAHKAMKYMGFKHPVPLLLGSAMGAVKGSKIVGLADYGFDQESTKELRRLQKKGK